MNAIITVEDLTFRYPSLTAIENANLSIPKGSITALVGPNGAGKSTLMRCLTGLDTPFSGKITISGVNVLENQRLAHTKMGYLSDSFGLYDELTVRDVLIYMGGCHQIKGDALNHRIDDISSLLRLESVISQKCGSLSRGWRQRVGIAMAIIHQPEVLILDEPASGLDPEARTELSLILKTLQRNGMTILVSSHILAELEEYCTAMIVIRDGKILNHTNLDQHVSEQTLTLMLKYTGILTTTQKQWINDTYGTTHVPLIHKDQTFQMTVSSDPEIHHAILKQFMQNDIKICGLTLSEKKLQTLYLEIASEAAGKA